MNNVIALLGSWIHVAAQFWLHLAVEAFQGAFGAATSDKAVALAQVVAAAAAATALVLNLRDRLIRDRPVLILHAGRYVTSKAKVLRNESFLRNEGSGPAFDVTVGFGLVHTGPPSLRWAIAEKPTLVVQDSIGAGESIQLETIQAATHMALDSLGRLGLDVIRPSGGAHVAASAIAIYSDRGRRTFFQEYQFGLKAELEAFPISELDPTDVFLFGEHDPLYREMVEQDTGMAKVGLIAVEAPWVGPVRRLRWWDRRRPVIRRLLRLRNRLRSALRTNSDV